MRPSGRKAIRQGSSNVAVVVILNGKVASGFCSPTLTWAQAPIAELKSSDTLANFMVILLVSLSRDVVQYAVNYFGIGIDTALPAPRSAIQIVSPAGSTPVGILSPSLITVTLALSPLTVMTEILPLPFSATISLPRAARIPSGPFIG